MITREEFSKFMLLLVKAVPTFAPDMDNETLAVWYPAFKDCSREEMSKIYSYVRDNEVHFPSIAKMKSLLRTGEATSRFQEVLDLMGSVGGYRAPQVDTLMAIAINRMGGWQRICSEWNDDNLPFRKKEFDAVYAELVTQQKIGQLPVQKNLALQGAHETTPVKIDPPTLKAVD